MSGPRVERVDKELVAAFRRLYDRVPNIPTVDAANAGADIKPALFLNSCCDYIEGVQKLFTKTVKSGGRVELVKCIMEMNKLLVELERHLNARAGVKSEESFPLLDLPPPLLDMIVDDMAESGTKDDVAALRATCKTLRAAVKPAGKGGRDELTPEGATVSMARLRWSVSMCGWPSRTKKRMVPDVLRGLLPVMHCQECPDFRPICGWAAYRGNLNVLKWARENGQRWDRMTCKLAATGGHLNVLQWARQNGAPWNEKTCELAAFGGHLEVLQWLRQNGAPWDTMTCARAAEGGQLEVLKWARENGAPWDKCACIFAAAGGYLEVLQWARQNGAPWNESACAFAANRGHLKVLKWARENGAPWDEMTCEYAAAGGYFEVLKWARQNGAPWNEETCASAALIGHIEMLKWARQNGAPWNWERCLVNADSYGFVMSDQIIQWIEGNESEG